MNIFNSLGSNYTDSFVKKALTTKNNPGDIDKLTSFLSKKYGGEVHITYKGRDALVMALRASHLPPNAKVAITGFTCVAVYLAVKEAGFIPVLLDIEGTSLNYTPEVLKRQLEQDVSIKAVIVQNTLSYPCNIEVIERICREHACMLIEDGAHCVGTIYENGKEVGTVGDIVALSFSQDKIIDGISGGALIIRNKALQRFTADPIIPRSWMQEKKDRWYPLFTRTIRETYPHGFGVFAHIFFKTFKLLPRPVEATNKKYALSPFHAKLILDAYIRLPNDIKHRQQIAQMYHQYLDTSIQSAWIADHILTSSNLRFPIFVQNRHKLISYLKEKEVHVSDIWYDAPIGPKSYHVVPEQSLTSSEQISSTILNLPTHKHVTSSDAIAIAQLINTWLKQNK